MANSLKWTSQISRTVNCCVEIDKKNENTTKSTTVLSFARSPIVLFYRRFTLHGVRWDYQFVRYKFRSILEFHFSWFGASTKLNRKKEYLARVRVCVCVCVFGTSAENVNMLRKCVCTVLLSFLHIQPHTHTLRTQNIRRSSVWQRLYAVGIHRLTFDRTRTMRCYEYIVASSS